MRADEIGSSTCLHRFYGDITTLACKSCPYDFYTCDANNNCLTCQSSDFRTLNSTTQRCSPSQGYYQSNVTMAIQCPQGCQTWSGPQLCLSCKVSFYMQTDQLCHASCPERYYPKTNNLTYTLFPLTVSLVAHQTMPAVEP